MRVALVVLYAAFAAATPNPRPQEEDASSSAPVGTIPGITTLNTTLPSIPLPTLPSGNFTLPISPNVTLTGPPVSITPSATLPSWTTRTHKPHTEPIPIFTSKCNCADPLKGQKPCWATDSLQKCHVEEVSSATCWFINRGCPSPTRECDKLFTPEPLGTIPCNGGGLLDIRPAYAEPRITAVPELA